MVLFLIAGCGLQKSDLVGSYSGEFSLSEEQQRDPRTAILANFKPSLTLKDDDTFVMNALADIGGKWSFDGETVTLNIETVAGVAVPESQRSPLSFTVKDNGKVLEGTAPDNQAPVVFRRNES
jgi:hypothetical protein